MAWRSEADTAPADRSLGPLIPWLWGAVLTGCALFVTGASRDYLLVAVMLFGPLCDPYWSPPSLRNHGAPLGWALALALSGIAIVAIPGTNADFAISSVFTVALPEEWFFRGYFMERIGKGWMANVVASVMFATLHGITRGPDFALKVFGPSLAFGWIYQRTRYLPLVIMVHGFSNLVYHVYLARFLHHLV